MGIQVFRGSIVVIVTLASTSSASAATTLVQSGSITATVGGQSLTGQVAVITDAPTFSSISPTAAPSIDQNQADASESSSDDSSGATVAAVVSVLLLLICVIGTVYYLRHKRQAESRTGSVVPNVVREVDNPAYGSTTFRSSDNSPHFNIVNNVSVRRPSVRRMSDIDSVAIHTSRLDLEAGEVAGTPAVDLKGEDISEVERTGEEEVFYSSTTSAVSDVIGEVVQESQFGHTSPLPSTTKSPSI